MPVVPLAFVGDLDVETIPWKKYGEVPAGYMKLVTPIGHIEGNMFMITITAYRFWHGNEPFQVHCTGYTPAWNGGLFGAKCETNGTDLPVEIGTELRPGGTAPVVVIRIGTPATQWYFPLFGAQYVGWLDKDPAAFQFVTGETTPAPGPNHNNVVIDDAAGTIKARNNVQFGSTLFLQDSRSIGDAGGLLTFGALQGHFASIRGSLADGQNNTMGHLVFATRNATTDAALTERMRIDAAGNVGIGTIVPAARLDVSHTADQGLALNAVLGTTVEQNTTQVDRGLFVGTYQTVNAGVTNSGSITGATVAATKAGSGNLATTVGQQINTGIMAAQSGSLTSAYGLLLNVVAGQGAITNGFAVYINDVAASNGYGVYQAGANDLNYFAGKVGIGTPPTANALEVSGNANFSGTVTGNNIRANYQDVAEWVPATEALSAGTVVILDQSRSNHVVPSSRPYDTTVAGVVSARPGIILGEEGDSKAMIATTGRVRVRVDATKHAIAIGDLLVTSGKAGLAMKSVPLELQGIAIHRPGTVVGKALEPLANGEGEILVLLSLQ